MTKAFLYLPISQCEISSGKVDNFKLKRRENGKKTIFPWKNVDYQE